MRNLVILSLILLLLALNCKAIEPVQLSGINGQTILAQIASTNITNQITKASATDLWSWGNHTPLNYVLNKSGKLSELPEEPPSDDNVWLGTISQGEGLNTSIYT